MKNKKVLIGIYLLVILGVFYFVHKALNYSETSIPDSLEAETEAIDQLLLDGLSDFQAQDLDNNTFTLSKVSSPIVIINFWASWCAPCLEEFPSFIRLLEKFEGKVTLVAISVDENDEQTKSFLANLSLSHKNLIILKDPQYFLAEKFGTFKIPESYIFTKDRKLLKKISGSIDWMSPQITSTINEQLSGKLAD